MTTLRFMGSHDPHWRETFRCRVYGYEPDEQDRKRVALVRQLATDGVLDCPAYEQAMAALEERGYATMALEPNPDGPGRVGRWRLTEEGLAYVRGLGVL
jgi:hypothetical protein